MRRQMFAVLALAPMLALGLTACGTGKDPAAKAAASKSSDLDSMRKFAQCMRQNGVNMPDPVDAGGGRVAVRASRVPGANTEEKMKAAEAKCRHFQPNGGKPVKLKPEDLAKMRAMAKCMREHGVDMPDPDPDGSVSITKGKNSTMDLDSPTFKAADKACRKFAPGQIGQRAGGGS
jgi:hypothetical protein